MNEDKTDNQPAETPAEEVSAEQTEQSSEAVVSSSNETKAPWYKNKLYIVLAVLTLVAIVGLALVSSNSGSDQASLTEQSAGEETQTINLASVIALTEGTVEYSSNAQDWQAAEGGETVSVGDSVRTAEKSRAIVLLDDGSAVRLDGETEVQLMTSDTESSEVLLIEGQVYSRVVESDTRVFAVVTKNERFEALGTAYKTSTDDEKDTLEVYQSTVKVESDETEVEEGNEYDTKDRKKSSIDLDTLTDDEFVQWNKDKDEKDENFKKKLGVLEFEVEEKPVEEPVQPADPAAALSLSGNTTDKGIYLSWNNSGVSAADGYKVVYSKSDTTPSYKENDAQYVGAGSTSHTVGLDKGGVYYIRICAYRANSGTCDSYSNTVTITAPVVKKEVVKAGAVTLSIDGRNVSWTIAGTAPHGYKVLLNTGGSPTYPANSIQYTGASSAQLPEKANGTYFVRVCKYTADASVNGGCTDYSNQVEYVVVSE